jgi:hypothetical protein
MNPFAQATQAPVAGFAPAAQVPSFDKLLNATMHGVGRPKPEENHNYIVEVTDYKFVSGTYHVECVIVEAPTGGSPVGFETSVSQNTKSNCWEGYFKRQILANMGVSADDPAAVAAALPFLVRCLTEALTKVADPSLPVHLIGRRMQLVVSPGKPAQPGKKYYPNEVCFPCN